MDLLQAVDQAAITKRVSLSVFIRWVLMAKLKDLAPKKQKVPPEIIEKLRAQYHFFDNCDEEMKQWLIGQEMDKLK